MPGNPHKHSLFCGSTHPKNIAHTVTHIAHNAERISRELTLCKKILYNLPIATSRCNTRIQ